MRSRWDPNETRRGGYPKVRVPEGWRSLKHVCIFHIIWIPVFVKLSGILSNQKRKFVMNCQMILFDIALQNFSSGLMKSEVHPKKRLSRLWINLLSTFTRIHFLVAFFDNYFCHKTIFHLKLSPKQHFYSSKNQLISFSFRFMAKLNGFLSIRISSLFGFIQCPLTFTLISHCGPSILVLTGRDRL